MRNTQKSLWCHSGTECKIHWSLCAILTLAQSAFGKPTCELLYMTQRITYKLIAMSGWYLQQRLKFLPLLVNLRSLISGAGGGPHRRRRPWVTQPSTTDNCGSRWSKRQSSLQIKRGVISSSWQILQCRYQMPFKNSGLTPRDLEEKALTNTASLIRKE